MSSSTSSLSILTIVPLTSWPSSTSTSVPSMASAKDMPRSSTATSRGGELPSSSNVPNPVVFGAGAAEEAMVSDKDESAFEGGQEMNVRGPPSDPDARCEQ